MKNHDILINEEPKLSVGSNWCYLKVWNICSFMNLPEKPYLFPQNEMQNLNEHIISIGVLWAIVRNRSKKNNKSFQKMICEHNASIAV